MSISDVTGYRELVVEVESASGTVADDTAVSLVLDVASSETGGGIEEAPEDGKQYARQDGDWTEVEATSGGGSGGDVEAQPPVAFEVGLSANASVLSDGTWLKCELDAVVTDTDSAIKDGVYTIPKDGIYNISFIHGVSA